MVSLIKHSVEEIANKLEESAIKTSDELTGKVNDISWDEFSIWYSIFKWSIKCYTR